MSLRLSVDRVDIHDLVSFSLQLPVSSMKAGRDFTLLTLHHGSFGVGTEIHGMGHRFSFQQRPEVFSSFSSEEDYGY